MILQSMKLNGGANTDHEGGSYAWLPRGDKDSLCTRPPSPMTRS